MSADLALYAIAYDDVETLELWQRLQNVTAISDDPELEGEMSFTEHSRLWHQVSVNSNYLEVGQVSSLSAGLTGDFERYVPSAVWRTMQLIGDGKVLTAGLAKEITVAFNQPNRSVYGHVTYERVPARIAREHRERARAGGHEARYWSAFREPNILILRKGRGVAKGRPVKRFLQANIGRYLVCDLV